MSDLWAAWRQSIQVAAIACALLSMTAIPLAYWASRRRFRGRSLAESVLLLPLVLPPTVLGSYLVALLGRRGVLGQYLDAWFGYSMMFHWHGAVLAAAVVAFPLMYLPCRSAFAGSDRELEDVARLFGAGRLQILWHVTLPLARRGIAAGVMLAFCRSLGEFGATIMVLGDVPRYRTLPILIYNDYMAGGSPGTLSPGMAATLLLTLLSLAAALVYNRCCRPNSD